MSEWLDALNEYIEASIEYGVDSAKPYDSDDSMAGFSLPRRKDEAKENFDRLTKKLFSPQMG